MLRRQFLQALAASVVAAGAPLPVGFPEQDELVELVMWDVKRSLHLAQLQQIKRRLGAAAIPQEDRYLVLWEPV